MNTGSYQQLMDHILSLPNAPILLKQINTKLEEEKKRRIRFYNEITEYEKAEFINGQIVIHSPVKKEHNDVTIALLKLISSYVEVHKLGYVGCEKIMISLSRNDYEPGLCFFNKEKSRDFTKGQTLFPAPDLIVEVLSKGTAGNDRGVKFDDYQAHKILEYWIIDPDKETVEQYRLNEAQKYELILKASEGDINCKAIGGFKIAIASIFDEEVNLRELKRILA